MTETSALSAGAAAVPAARARAARTKSRRRSITAYLFLTPYLLLLLAFGVFPVGYAIGLSFFDTISGSFAGLMNYELALDDFRLGQSFVNVITYVAMWVSLMIVGVVALATIIDLMPRRLGTTVRTVTFLPSAVTSAAVVVLWLFLLDPQVSPFKAVYGLLGWENRFQVFDSIGFAGVFTLMAFFAYAGGWIVVLHGALTALPGEVMEAGRVDGCRPVTLALRVKIPMIWRTVALMAVLSIANGLQLFVEPQLLGLAGPQLARNDWSLNQLAYQYAFALGDFGVSAALSTMILALSVSIALWIVFATRFYRID
ncbi:carbohydrate ABC transporter permease [Bauldia sp.]|uniref:carbohydrate ABC transporter permease n=1 Tax=Bauldia sp. TaxID=2575872 RepID=UPI003BAD3831